MINQEIGADTEIPDSSFILPPRDDAAEFDDSSENYNFNDDPKYVYCYNILSNVNV